MKKAAVLGATGSIGKSALDVLRRSKDDFDVVLLTAHRSGDELRELAKDFPHARLALSGEVLQAIAEAGADITVNGIAGAAGLEPSLAVLRSGSDLALANKETIVMAGPLVLTEARKAGRRIIPVDSEHQAIWSLLAAHGRTNLKEILLTASGGPFRTYTKEQLAQVKKEDALAHPTWNMGPKITVDSASMANKGLEVIEAVRLFDVPPEKIKVVVHPQSIVHSMLRLTNGAVYAQLSRPDMRLPIMNALYSALPAGFPSIEELSFDDLTLSFAKPDTGKFPLLPLAYEAARRGGLYPAVYNAANEKAVEAFLEGKIAFLDIPSIVEYALDKDLRSIGDIDDTGDTLEGIMEADRQGRELAADYIRRRK
ncbi:1-deoxy-D-xylulose 5-phosphate reductoisomerase [Spirochaetia bacterium]|nr:1-deoxy-D-xylulose 5-phosphate reductoisomerase [Spirochaetia bacterium]